MGRGGGEDSEEGVEEGGLCAHEVAHDGLGSLGRRLRRLWILAPVARQKGGRRRSQGAVGERVGAVATARERERVVVRRHAGGALLRSPSGLTSIEYKSKQHRGLLAVLFLAP